jgi:hypothetical protein
MDPSAATTTSSDSIAIDMRRSSYVGFSGQTTGRAGDNAAFFVAIA